MFLWWAFFGCAAGVIGCGYGVFSLMLLEGSYQPLGILEAASFRTAEEAHAASLAARDPDPVDVYEVLMLGIPLLAVAAAVVFLALLHLDAGRRRRKRERHEPTRVLGAAVASMS